MFASRSDWSLIPNRLSEVLDERLRLGLPILDLTESNPTRCRLIYDTGSILGALADARSLTYEPNPRGLLCARIAVARYYAERGVRVDPAHIFLTTSTSEAYAYVFRLLADPGDNILVPQPSYPLLDFLARLDGLEIVRYRLVYDEGWQLDVESLTASLSPRTRAIVLIHPNNPTGSFVRQEELRFLLECCRERGLAIIADEVFADYALEPNTSTAKSHQRVSTHVGSSEALTFTLSGLSKISALPQMKLAWIVVSGPAEHRSTARARLELIADTYLSVSTPLAYALPELLETRRTLQPQILDRVCRNLRWLDRQLSSGSSVRCLKSEGGWYAILKLPCVQSDEEWAIELLARDGVLVHPGHFYDFDSEGYLVVSLLPPPEVFEEGITKILARVSTTA